MKAVCQLSEISEEYFPTDFARIILISQMILSMIKVRTVSLGEMASGFGGKAKTDSNERRMRRFLGNFPPDPDSVVFFIASELPEGKWIITADRTEWEFGKMKTDILMLAVVCKGVAIPLLWKFLTKKDDPNVGKKEIPILTNGKS